ncbi:MAG TPA: hypothetical protein VGF62_05485 [Rhizomicrobium sp.]
MRNVSKRPVQPRYQFTNILMFIEGGNDDRKDNRAVNSAGIRQTVHGAIGLALVVFMGQGAWLNHAAGCPELAAIPTVSKPLRCGDSSTGAKLSTNPS